MFESVKGLCAALEAGAKVRPEVFAGEDEFTRVDRSSWKGVQLHIALPALGGIGRSLRLFRELNELSFDIAHLHGIWGPASRAMALWKTRRQKVPYLISPRGMLEPWALQSGSISAKKLGWILWQGRLLRQATCIHALCEPEAASIADLKLGRPICVIPNGVALPDEPKGPPSVSPTLLFLGRIHPKKGLAELLTAFAKVEADRRGDWRVVIAGWDDGGHLSALQRLAGRLGIEASVEFPGAVYGDEKDRLFRQSTAFILPSHSEGLPMSVLEAWSYGRPAVISTECHLDIGYERGAAIRADADVTSIEQGLRDLFSKTSAELAAMGKNGRNLVAEKFTWESVAEQFALVYDWMLGGPKPDCVI